LYLKGIINIIPFFILSEYKNMTMKILIVDDSNSQRKHLKSLLQEHEIFEAENGLDALESANDNLPDLIIMDIIMPGIDGFSALKMLKSNPKTKDITVIMTSDKETTFDKYRAKQLEASEVLSKPFKEEKVLEALKLASTPYLKHCLEKELNSTNQKPSHLVKV
jgi:twitching motility two-component system response regulator PilH